MLSLKGSSTFFGSAAVPKLVDCSHPGLQPTIEIGAHGHTCVSKGFAREQQKVQWLSDPCILKHGTRIVLNPAVFWGKTILPGHAPAHLSAWDTSAHRHTSVGEQISSPPTYHPQPPANHSWCKCTMFTPCLPSLTWLLSFSSLDSSSKASCRSQCCTWTKQR